MGVPYNLPSPRQVTDAGATSPPPPTHLWAVWAGTNYPPPQRHPLPQENCHLRLTSVKTSFWPLNLGQKSWIGHKMTEGSISGQTASLYEVRQLS